MRKLLDESLVESLVALRGEIAQQGLASVGVDIQEFDSDPGHMGGVIDGDRVSHAGADGKRALRKTELDVELEPSPQEEAGSDEHSPQPKIARGAEGLESQLSRPAGDEEPTGQLNLNPLVPSNLAHGPRR